MVLAHQLVIDPEAPTVPVLPPIDDTAVEQQVFAHSSYLGNPVANFEHAPNAPRDNTHLALYGDAILREMLTGLVQQAHPNLSIGRVTQMLGSILSNDTFARIAARLGMPERLRTSLHQQQTVRNGTVARATVFEAYIGGLLVAGTARADVLAFIQAIFTPIIHHEYEYLARGNAGPAPSPATMGPAAPGHLDTSIVDGHTLEAASNNWVSAVKEYNESRGRRPKAISYLETRTGPPHGPTFIVEIMIDGTVYGRGRGSTVKNARNAACMQAYDNRQIVWGR